MKEAVTILLVHPIEHGNEKIEKLVLRRPLAGDLYDFPAEAKMGDLMDLAAKLSSQPPSVIKRLEMDDTFPVLEVVGNFMKSGRETGKAK